MVTGEVPKHKAYQRTIARSVDDLTAMAGIREWWVYRGQASDWRLRPKLERGRPKAAWLRVESEAVARAQAAHPGRPDLPEDEHLGWLGLLCHAGEPVRLLDFTRRLAVAAFFATAEATRDVPTVWAIDGERVTMAWKSRVTPRNQPLRVGSPYANWKEFNRLFPSADIGPAAMLVEPRVRNRRQELQKGLFLTGLDMRYSLEDNLFGSLGHEPTAVIPDRNRDGVFKGPVGVNLKPLEGSGLRRLRDARLVQIELQIPDDEIAAYLESENLTERTLGLEDGPYDSWTPPSTDHREVEYRPGRIVKTLPLRVQIGDPPERKD